MYTSKPLPPALEERFTRNDAFRRVCSALGEGQSAFVPWTRFKEGMTPDEVYGLFKQISGENRIVRPVGKSFFER